MGSDQGSPASIASLHGEFPVSIRVRLRGCLQEFSLANRRVQDGTGIQDYDGPAPRVPSGRSLSCLETKAQTITQKNVFLQGLLPLSSSTSEASTITSTPRDCARYGLREDRIREAAHPGPTATLSHSVGGSGMNRFPNFQAGGRRVRGIRDDPDPLPTFVLDLEKAPLIVDNRRYLQQRLRRRQKREARVNCAGCLEGHVGITAPHGVAFHACQQDGAHSYLADQRSVRRMVGAPVAACGDKPTTVSPREAYLQLLRTRDIHMPEPSWMTGYDYDKGTVLKTRCGGFCEMKATWQRSR